MPFKVTTRKRGGFEYTNVAHTEGAAMSLAQMMRRAGDEYCAESTVTVLDNEGAVVAAWRGGSWGWRPVAQAPAGASGQSPSLQPLGAKGTAAPPKQSGRFRRLPTEPMQSSVVSISITEYSAV
jgi:hypothetical protein